MPELGQKEFMFIFTSIYVTERNEVCIYIYIIVIMIGVLLSTNYNRAKIPLRNPNKGMCGREQGRKRYEKFAVQ